MRQNLKTPLCYAMAGLAVSAVSTASAHGLDGHAASWVIMLRHLLIEHGYLLASIILGGVGLLLRRRVARMRRR